jgi:hypothetical protein
LLFLFLATDASFSIAENGMLPAQTPKSITRIKYDAYGNWTEKSQPTALVPTPFPGFVAERLRTIESQKTDLRQKRPGVLHWSANVCISHCDSAFVEDDLWVVTAGAKSADGTGHWSAAGQNTTKQIAAVAVM